MRKFGSAGWQVTGAELPLAWTDGLQRLEEKVASRG